MRLRERLRKTIDAGIALVNTEQRDPTLYFIGTIYLAFHFKITFIFFCTILLQNS
jgi:hypothetical protein